jgi:hypothetical protein
MYRQPNITVSGNPVKILRKIEDRSQKTGVRIKEKDRKSQKGIH